ncbi:MAG: NUDIX hydrolase [Christensenellaceae bacterium]|nr:NUDIX hydrolase [Christensenellaceae bacterium]
MAYIPSCPEEAEFLKNYDPYAYENPAVTVDMALFAYDKADASLHLLLIKRGGYPFKGRLALPGGFIELNEDLEASAARELLEETGVSGINPIQVYSFGALGRDPRHRIISVLHMALVDKAAVAPKAGDDAAFASWWKWEGFSFKDGRVSVTLRDGEKAMTFTATRQIGGRLTAPTDERIAADHDLAICQAALSLRESLVRGDIAAQLYPQGTGAEQLSRLCVAAFLPGEAWRQNPLLTEKETDLYSFC